MKRLSLIKFKGAKSAASLVDTDNDPFYNQLFFSLRVNSANQASDISPNKYYTNTTLGGTGITTTPLKSNPNGYKSAQIDGSYPASVAFNPYQPPGDFCIDFFARYHTAPRADMDTVILSTAFSTWQNGAFYIGTYNGSGYGNRITCHAANVFGISTVSQIPLNVWRHYAFERKGQTITAYVNGTVMSTISNPSYLGQVGSNSSMSWKTGPSPYVSQQKAPCYIYGLRFTKAARFNGEAFTIDSNKYNVA